ncbi:hypothetical protein OSB04_025738 [Centaurea solstitialis]|uniref:Uncharacterized protein n=1 Tax=Centaurea solstitialis TaxID=347529 RepID=A0AA38T206_9ASTR|nr:hypothetical protein OSB04_025738 [Centaurea solstitialis]
MLMMRCRSQESFGWQNGGQSTRVQCTRCWNRLWRKRVRISVLVGYNMKCHLKRYTVDTGSRDSLIASYTKHLITYVGVNANDFSISEHQYLFKCVSCVLE